MAFYSLIQPVEAVLYELNGNEKDIVQLVRGPEGRGSYSNMDGSLRFSGGPRPDLQVRDGEWVVKIADSVVVLSKDVFQRSFQTS